MIIPTEDEGYWLGCTCNEEAAETDIFMLQVVNNSLYLRCAKCGRVRRVEAFTELNISGSYEDK